MSLFGLERVQGIRRGGEILPDVRVLGSGFGVLGSGFEGGRKLFVGCFSFRILSQVVNEPSYGSTGSAGQFVRCFEISFINIVFVQRHIEFALDFPCMNAGHS